MRTVVMAFQWGGVGDRVERKQEGRVVQRGWIKEVVDPGITYLVEWERDDVK